VDDAENWRLAQADVPPPPKRTTTRFEEDGLVVGAMAGLFTIAGSAGGFVGYELGVEPIDFWHPLLLVEAGVSRCGLQYGGALRLRPLHNRRSRERTFALFVELGYSQGHHDDNWESRFFEVGSGVQSSSYRTWTDYGLTRWFQPALGFEYRQRDGFALSLISGWAIPVAVDHCVEHHDAKAGSDADSFQDDCSPSLPPWYLTYGLQLGYAFDS